MKDFHRDSLSPIISLQRKNKNQARPRLAWVNPNAPKKQKKNSCRLRDPFRAAPRRRVTKVKSKGLDRVDAGVHPLPTGDLLDAPLRDTGVLRDTGPFAFAFLQFLDNVVMDGLEHRPDDKPVSGFMQPENGRGSALRSWLMVVGRPQKVVTPKDIIGQILIDNVEGRWRRAFPTAKTDKDRLELLAKRSGVGKETLRKMMKGEQSPRIDTVDKVARALGTTCDELLRVSQQVEERVA